MYVRDVMTREVETVHPDTPLKEVARLLVQRGVSGLPVVRQDGQVLGVISEADFVLREERGPHPRHGRLEWLFGEDDRAADRRARLEGTTAGEAMTAPAVTIGSERSIREAAALMIEKAINRLPVLDDGRLVGIVSRADLVGAFLRTDDDLERAVRHEIIRDTMWMEPDVVRVKADEGVVTLGGLVDRRSTAEILVRLTSQLDGVIAVRDQLSWELDDRSIEPMGYPIREPGAASIVAREHSDRRG